MRILHTSDWHLGQYFIGKSRQREHQLLIDWLLTQVEALQIDWLLIAGDLFDTGTPPSYARELYNSLIIRLHDAGCRLVVLAGNHDSAAVLAESRHLLARFGACVIPTVLAPLSDQLLLLTDRQGLPAAWLCAVPFLRPRDLVQSQPGQSAEQKQQDLQQAISQHYQQLYQLAQAQQAQFAQPLPILATGHLTTLGASRSESVREIYVGSLDAFPTSAFPPVDYLALGHIHRPQKVGGLEHIRYCGSPIPLSFDELGQNKQMLLVELDAQGLQQVIPVSIPCFQPMASIEGSLAELSAQLVQIAEQAQPGLPVWLEVKVRADDYLPDLQSRIQALVQDLPIQVLKIRRLRSEAVSLQAACPSQTLDELTPVQVFERRLSTEPLTPEVSAALLQRYRQLLAQLAEEM